MTTWIVLGSGSPRRRALLQCLGQPFSVVLPTQAVDETPLPHELSADMVQRLSLLKAQAVATTLLQRPNLADLVDSIETLETVILLTADTTVALDNQILGKPATPAEAEQMLKQLRQRPHQVYSSMTHVCWSIIPQTPLIHQLNEPPTHCLTQLHQNQVTMRPYNDREIAAYIATGAPLDKAGAYGIQDEEFAPVAHFDGCFASIMGLPIGQLARTWHQLGITVPLVAPLCEKYTGHPCCQA